jgi:hypothetical protein
MIHDIDRFHKLRESPWNERSSSFLAKELGSMDAFDQVIDRYYSTS